VKTLIVNADDLGWTEGVNRGIAEAHQSGIVTSASLLANGPAFQEAVELLKSLPNLGVGVHLNLSDGVPVTERARVESLVGADGEFHGGPEKLLVRIVRRKLDVNEVEQEWDAQIGKIREAGLKPTHIDGHKHVQMLPGLFEIALKVAKRHGIGAVRVSLESPELCLALLAGCDDRAAVWMQGARAQGFRLVWRKSRRQAEESGIATADYFCGIAQTGALTKEGVLQLLRSLPDGTTELMCHPGNADEALRQTATRLQDSRQKEIEILTDPEIRNLVASQGIRLIDYGSVAHRA
jgi:hopanoid biosynthesis associated protein HpnK